MTDLKSTIAAATKAAVRARERDRVKALRLVNAAVKQTEIDQRKPLADADVLAVLTKMRKQRRDSLQQFQDAGRDDLATIEQFEIGVIEEFMPEALSADALAGEVEAVIAEVGARRHETHGQGDGRHQGARGRARRHGRGQPNGAGSLGRLAPSHPAALCLSPWPG